MTSADKGLELVDITFLTERFLSAAPSKQANIFSLLVAELRQAVDAGQFDEAAAGLRRVILPTLGYTQAQSFHQVRRELRDKAFRLRQKIKVAVLGSVTTKQLVSFIDLHLFAAGIDAEIYEGEYGVFRQEILDLGSPLHEFAPQIVFLATTWRDLAHRPNAETGRAEANGIVKAEQSNWSLLWQAAHDKFGCQVLQNNFTVPAWRSFANYELRHPGSFSRYVALMNQSMMDAAPPFVTIHDVDHLATAWGRWRWQDPRFFYQAKLPCDPECLVDYAHSVASIIATQLGLAKKCLVLDLDNTIWGGVIGDDGLGGIRLSQGDPEGEAFREFQVYLKSLRLRGVLLAVCSKNREEVVLEVFEKHPDMVLHREDISCFVVNWSDKATNLRTIAKTLNVGLDALVFVDDHPAERAVVRRLVPDVAVPELPEDATGYIKAIEDHRYFQVLSVGAEDLRRTEYYRADSIRRAVQVSAADLEAFLQSLDMIAEIGSITPVTLERSAQLIQRSNQFNLTTRRRSAAEISSLLADEAWTSRTLSLEDRFGDNGLISVVLAHAREELLEIDTWVMSCRVLQRGVEQCLLNHLHFLARQLGLKAIRGMYIPTAKNQLVQDHYAKLGFTRIGTENGEATGWELRLAEDWRPLPHFIKERRNGGTVKD
jgi:FkbH-like protein